MLSLNKLSPRFGMRQRMTNYDTNIPSVLVNKIRWWLTLINSHNYLVAINIDRSRIKVTETPIYLVPRGPTTNSFTLGCQNNMQGSGAIVEPRLDMKFPTKQTIFAQPWRRKDKTCRTTKGQSKKEFLRFRWKNNGMLLTDGRQNAPSPQKNMIIENSLDEQTTLFSTFFHLTKMQNAMSFILC